MNNSKKAPYPINKFLILVPVFNEENSIKEMLEKIRQHNRNAAILVINDGSTDRTSALLKNQRDIYTISREKNLGYGQTLIDGFEFSITHNYEYLITIDSDKQHQPEEIQNFTTLALQEDWDIISGSRYLDHSQNELNNAPIDRRKINRRITQKINILTGYNLTDAFCGFKLYKVSALQKLRLQEPGYGMPLELWIQAWKLNLRIKEIPVALIYLDKNSAETASYQKMFRRYKYYLTIIEKEFKHYEDISISSASG